MANGQQQSNLVVGIDIGGTFTDIVLINEEQGKLLIAKELTSTEDPSRAVLQGLRNLLEKNQLSFSDLGHVVHATTLVTNAIIERKGAPTGLITTEGFADVLEIGREAKYDLYDLFLEVPTPLIPRHRRKEASERVDIDGAVIRELDLDSVSTAVDALVADGCESIAIAFLHAYINREHEEQAAAHIKKRHPSLSLSLGSDVAPEIREYERINTTAANAFVQPLINQYLNRLLNELREEGFTGSFAMMLSNGGLTPVAQAQARPIGLLESGPAAGALVAGHYARMTGIENMIAFDMGGTTAKLCLIEDAEPSTTHLFEAARVQRFKRGSGLPIRTTSVDLIEIGAGGGSIAHVDELGLLKVGPKSAGAVPGPACYGRGGTEPTVTDANLILGYYDSSSFLGGEMPLDRAAAEEAIGKLAAKLGMSAVEAAWGIHNVVNEQMASAARIHVAEKGQDARKQSMLTTGGGAPCHGPRIAQKLQIPQLISPPNAGVASAFGLLIAPSRVDLVRSAPMRVDEMNWTHIGNLYDEMKQEAAGILAEGGTAAADIRYTLASDMRYVGQGFEITVDITGADESADRESMLITRFEAAYRQQFARSLEGVAVESLTWRLTATGAHREYSQDSTGAATTTTSGEIQPDSTRLAYFPEWEEHREVSVYSRYSLSVGASGDGPAIIEERESTTVVPPDCSWRVIEDGMLQLNWGIRA